MKKDKDKCKKGKESTIGKIIYGFLLFLPLMAIGVTCSYAIFNKNAYQSLSAKDDTLSTITTDTQFSTGETYYFNADEFYNFFTSGNHQTPKIKFSRISLDLNSIFANTYDYESFSVVKYENILEYDFYYNGGTSYKYATNADGIWQIDYLHFINFDFVEILESGEIDKAFSINIKTTGTLDNIFYYSINKVEQSNLFNWAKNSVIYTGMNEFTTSLSITNTFIPLLLTYWLIISLVYFIYDIVLIIFNVLHRKIHELQDSI